MISALSLLQQLNGNNMKKRILLLFVVFLQTFLLFAQQDWKGDYTRAKQVYDLQKYGIAMEYFLPLTSPDETNPYASYAQYYYALSAFKVVKYNEARQMLLQLINRDPNWKQKNEAEYLLACVYFEMKNYQFAMTSLSQVNGMESSVLTCKQSYYSKIEPIDTLAKLQRIYTTDKELAKALFNKLAVYPVNSKNNMLYEYLAQDFKFEKIKKSVNYVKKQEYHVAVIFPFSLSEPISEHPRNSYVDEMYQGILGAIDSLKKQGVNVIVHPYDVDRDVLTVQKIIAYPEFKNMDLIIGPLFPTLIPYVTSFGEKNNIPVINPISLNSSIVENTTQVLLFQPTLESIAGDVSSFAKSNFMYRKNDEKDTDTKPKNEVVIFYTTDIKDSLQAVYYRDSLLTKGFKVSKFVRITRSKISSVGKIIADSISLTKTSHVFVSSSDAALASNVISALEIARVGIPIIAKSEWLDINNQTYEQFERRKVYFIYPDFVSFYSESYKNFNIAYTKRFQTHPSKYSVIGFELMSLVGEAMDEYGTGYLNYLRTSSFHKGHFMAGFDFGQAACNSYVPIYYFNNLQLTLANPINEK
jgi:tetratricopeptide (TPR) repeat protein